MRAADESAADFRDACRDAHRAEHLKERRDGRYVAYRVLCPDLVKVDFGDRLPVRLCLGVCYQAIDVAHMAFHRFCRIECGDLRLDRRHRRVVMVVMRGVSAVMAMRAFDLAVHGNVDDSPGHSATDARLRRDGNAVEPEGVQSF